MKSRTMVAATLIALCGCTRHAAQPAIDPALARCVPAATQVLAGVNLEKLGALQTTVRSLLAPTEGTRYMLVALTGKDVLVIANTGCQPRPADSAAPELLSQAEPLAAANPLWLIAQGGATLPIAGNLANLNRFLHSTEYTTVAVQPGDRLSIEVSGHCRDAETAQHLEANLRAFVSLASAVKKDRKLPDIRIHAGERTVRVSLSAAAAELEQLIR